MYITIAVKFVQKNIYVQKEQDFILTEHNDNTKECKYFKYSTNQLNNIMYQRNILKAIFYS